MEQKPGSLSEKIPFETLIKGPYREDFQKKVEEILRKRFRQLEKSRREAPAARDAAEKPDGAPGEDGGRDARLTGEKDTMRGEARQAAAPEPAAGDVTRPDAPEPKAAFAPENDTIRDETGVQDAAAARPEGAKQALSEAMAGGSPASSENGGAPEQTGAAEQTGTPEQAGTPLGNGTPGGTDRRYERILRSAREAKRAYPQFQLRQELGSRRFAELVFRGVDVKTAYEAVHHDEMLRAAMGYGVKRASEKLSRAKMERPSENGSESQSVAVSRRDPARLSPEEREDIRRRVLERGERVRF